MKNQLNQDLPPNLLKYEVITLATDLLPHSIFVIHDRLQSQHCINWLISHLVWWKQRIGKDVFCHHSGYQGIILLANS